MRTRWILGVILPWLIAAIPAEPPPELTLTADELAKVTERKVAVRLDTSDTGGGVTGVIDVAADAEHTWAALMDLEARVGEIGGLKSVQRYVDEPARIGVRWELKVLTVTIVFHNLYDVDREHSWVRYSLDDSRENDLVRVEGAYQIYANDTGGTRLVYRSEMDSGRKIPMWVKRWIATDSLTEQLTNIRARAEAAR